MGKGSDPLKTSRNGKDNLPAVHLRLAIPLVFAAASLFGAVTIQENFASNPMAGGWRIFGDTNLFRWNPANQNLEVTWNSSKTNSYFYRRLQNILTKSDDFALQFDLRMQDIALGVTSNKTNTFELAIGFLNFGSATVTNFFRGSGVNAAFGPKNLIEFDYFPDSGFGATFAPTAVSSNNVIVFSDNHPLELTVGNLFHFDLRYTASNQVLHTTVLRNGQPFGLAPDNSLGDLSLAAAPDFRVDTVAVMSYSDIGQSPPQFAGSILAHGTVDNLGVTMPGLPVQNLSARSTNQSWQVEFLGRTNWNYTLERSIDLQNWSAASATVPGTGTNLSLIDTNAAGMKEFYRVRADRP